MRHLTRLLLLSFCLAGAAIPAHAQVGPDNLTEAISDIMGAGDTAARIRVLRAVPSVGVLDINMSGASRFSRAGQKINDLRILAERNAVGVARLRRALVANPVTRRVMAEHGVNVRRVIGVSIGASGSLRFFVE